MFNIVLEKLTILKKKGQFSVGITSKIYWSNEKFKGNN